MTDKRTGRIVGVAIFGVLLIAGILGVGNSSSSTAGMDGATKEAIYSTCHDAVKDQLTSPATANFHDEKIAKAASGWSLTGQVDSQNGFGATLTSAFACDTDHSGIADPPAIVTS